MNPFTFWSQALAAQTAWTRLGLDMAATASASQSVLDKRMPMIAAVMSDPVSANYAELSRMVPEKVEAFWRATQPWMTAWPMMSAFGTGGVGMSGNWLTAQRDFARTATKALSPVKRAAQANARRLGR